MRMVRVDVKCNVCVCVFQITRKKVNFHQNLEVERKKERSGRKKAGRKEGGRNREAKGERRKNKKLSSDLLIDSKGMPLPRKKVYSYHEVQREGRKSRHF